MSSPRSFDRLARIYRVLEYGAFERGLERARFMHLDSLRECRSILVLGEGDGRCLERLVDATPHAQVDCLDLSAAMLARAQQRLAGKPAAMRVNSSRADLLTTELPSARYDAVVTCFFLDCFDEAQAEKVMTKIAASLRPGALWLWADFTLPERGLARLRARLWLALLYAYFRWQTGLTARELPPVERYFIEKGFRRVATCSLQWGLLRSEVWRKK